MSPRFNSHTRRNSVKEGSIQASIFHNAIKPQLAWYDTPEYCCLPAVYRGPNRTNPDRYRSMYTQHAQGKSKVTFWAKCSNNNFMTPLTSSDSCWLYSASDSSILSVKQAQRCYQGKVLVPFFFLKRPVWVTLKTCAHILTWCRPINLAQRMDGSAMGYSPVETRRPEGALSQTLGFIVAAFLLS